MTFSYLGAYSATSKQSTTSDSCGWWNLNQEHQHWLVGIQLQSSYYECKEWCMSNSSQKDSYQDHLLGILPVLMKLMSKTWESHRHYCRMHLIREIPIQVCEH